LIPAGRYSDDQDFIEEALKGIIPEHKLGKANDGDKLLRLLDDLRQNNEVLPDIIFLDLNMPFRSGREVLKIVKAEKSVFRSIHIVVLTTSNADEDHRFCLEHGADSYLVKPNSFGDLMRILSAAIEVFSIKVDPSLK
jgi:CheY-like chemotaxis protein